MIGIRKGNSMFVFKYLPFLPIVFATTCIFTGSVVAILQVRNLVSDFERSSGVYLVAGFILLAIGTLVLAVSPGKTVLLNKELLVMTISESTAFSTATSQYGYNEIAGEFRLDTKYLCRQWFPRYSIILQTREFGDLRLTGHKYADLELLSEAVVEANKYLVRHQIVPDLQANASVGNQGDGPDSVDS